LAQNFHSTAVSGHSYREANSKGMNMAADIRPLRMLAQYLANSSAVGNS